MNIEELSNEELLELYELTYREVSEVSEEEQEGRGVGANIYPIMNVIPRADAKPLPEAIMTIYCPGKNQTNAFRSLPDPREQLTQSTVAVVAAAAGNEVAAIVAETITSQATPAASTTTPSPSPTPTPTPYVAPTVSEPTPSPTPAASSPAPSAPSPTPTPAPQPTPTPSPTPTPPSPSPGYY